MSVNTFLFQTVSCFPWVQYCISVFFILPCTIFNSSFSWFELFPEEGTPRVSSFLTVVLWASSGPRASLGLSVFLRRPVSPLMAVAAAAAAAAGEAAVAQASRCYGSCNVTILPAICHGPCHVTILPPDPYYGPCNASVALLDAATAGAGTAERSCKFPAMLPDVATAAARATGAPAMLPDAATERSSKRSNVKTHKKGHGDGSTTAAVVEPNCFLG